jgi:hypothetical protein
LILLSFVALFLVIATISLFIPSNVQISKAVLIRASQDIVIRELNDPCRWSEWYPSPDSVQPYVDPANNKISGIFLDRDQRNLLVMTGGGRDEVTAVFKKIDGGRQVPTTWKIIEGSDTSATLVWNISFHLRWYPWEKFSSLMFDKTYGIQMQEGLNNLKKRLEK